VTDEGLIRVGVIGCGVIAPTHVESFGRLDGVELAWACDTRLERAAQLAQRYGIERVTADVNEVYADASVDAVAICTDHASHAELVVGAFEAGKHVLCEKALGATDGDLDRMLTSHAKHPECRFGGVFQHRFDGRNRYLKQQIDAGTFGKMLTTSVQLRCYREASYYEDDWHGTWEKEGGSVLINQAIHFVDLAQWLTGGVASVAAHYTNRDHEGTIETEDALTASVGYVDGSLGSIEATSASNLNWEHSLAVHGTEGAVELRNGRAMKVAFAADETAERVSAELKATQEAPSVGAGKSYYGTGHTAQVADFVDAVREGREPFVTGEMAAETVRVVLAAYESYRTGRRVELASGKAAWV